MRFVYARPFEFRIFLPSLARYCTAGTEVLCNRYKSVKRELLSHASATVLDGRNLSPIFPAASKRGNKRDYGMHRGKHGSAGAPGSRTTPNMTKRANSHSWRSYRQICIPFYPLTSPSRIEYTRIFPPINPIAFRVTLPESSAIKSANPAMFVVNTP